MAGQCVEKNLRSLKVLAGEIDYDEVSEIVQSFEQYENKQTRQTEKAKEIPKELLELQLERTRKTKKANEILELELEICEENGEAIIVRGFSRYWAAVVLLDMNLLTGENIQCTLADNNLNGSNIVNNTHIIYHKRSEQVEERIVGPITEWADKVLERKVKVMASPNPHNFPK